MTDKFVVTPWEVKGNIDYNKIITEFGVKKITPELLQMINGLADQSKEQKQPPEVTDRFKELYRSAMRISMRAKLK